MRACHAVPPVEGPARWTASANAGQMATWAAGLAKALARPPAATAAGAALRNLSSRGSTHAQSESIPSISTFLELCSHSVCLC